MHDPSMVCVDSNIISEYIGRTFSDSVEGSPLAKLKAWLETIVNQNSAADIIKNYSDEARRDKCVKTMNLLNARIVANEVIFIIARIRSIDNYAKKLPLKTNAEKLKQRASIGNVLIDFVHRLNAANVMSETLRDAEWVRNAIQPLMGLTLKQCKGLINQLTKFSQELLKENITLKEYGDMLHGLVEDICQWALAAKKRNFPVVTDGIAKTIRRLVEKHQLEKLLAINNINQSISYVNEMLKLMKIECIMTLPCEKELQADQFKTLIEDNFLALAIAFKVFRDNISAPCNDDDLESIVTNSLKTLNFAIEHWNDIVRAL
jgi:hypothetical protein